MKITCPLTFGFFIDPPSRMGEERSTMSPSECNEIVYRRTLSMGVDIFVWRQGFVGATFPENLMDPVIYDPHPTLGINKARLISFPLIFFNSFVYAFYYEKLGGDIERSGTIKQHIDSAGLYWVCGNQLDGAKVILQCLAPMWSKEEFIYKAQRMQGLLPQDFQCMMIPQTPNSFEPTVQKLEQLYNKNPHFLECVSFLNGSVFLLQEGKFSESLVLSWSVVEQFLNILWGRYWAKNPSGPVDKSGETKNGCKLKKISIENWQAKPRIGLLEYEGVISEDLYLPLEAARGARNNFAHKMTSVEFSAAKQGHDCANKLIQMVTDIDLPHPGVFPI